MPGSVLTCLETVYHPLATPKGRRAGASYISGCANGWLSASMVNPPEADPSIFVFKPHHKQTGCKCKTGGI